MIFVAGLKSFSIHQGVSLVSDDRLTSLEALRYLSHPPLSEVCDLNLYLFQFQSSASLVAVSVPIFGVPLLSSVKAGCTKTIVLLKQIIYEVIIVKEVSSLAEEI